MEKQEWYRRIPKVDMLLETDGIRQYIPVYGYERVREAVRAELSELRARIAQLPGGEAEGTAEDDVLLNVICAQDAAEPGQSAECENVLTDRIGARLLRMQSPGLKKVLNGTGTILHTNLGRAPLGKEAASRVLETVSGYCNLEYDLEDGCRGERCGQIENILCEITGAEAAVAVNNNAAALLLILCTLAQGGEVIVSRGELVEIGGQFRIPDVMSESGAFLKEVGTTNKTRISDYRSAYKEGVTGCFMKVHTSNYRIVGFTEDVKLEQMAQLGRELGLPVIYDMGNGLMADLKRYGLDEPTVTDALKSGADVVLFSGDKLLGGPQAGILIGKKEYIDKMKEHPLARAFRVDKMTLAALEATFLQYIDQEAALKEIPVLKMICASPLELKERAEMLGVMLKAACPDLRVQVESCRDQVGGGSAPTCELEGYGVAVWKEGLSAQRMERKLRKAPVPLIVRVNHDRVLVDVRTLSDEEFLPAVEAFSGMEGGES